MKEKLQKISACVEFGKINLSSPYPPQMKGQPGADEYTKEALEEGISPSDIMEQALIPAMDRVGQKFTENKIFVPQMLLSAKAMNMAMIHLKPYFQSGEVKRKGTFIIGTVAGDLHDIGKNLFAMMVEGAGWEVVDLGTDVTSDKFLAALQQYPDAVIGMSALLTTTMANMETVIKAVKAVYPGARFIVGGAPLSSEFALSIGADAYGRDPQDGIKWLESLVA